jgi:hypothetical protein
MWLRVELPGAAFAMRTGSDKARPSVAPRRRPRFFVSCDCNEGCVGTTSPIKSSSYAPLVSYAPRRAFLPRARGARSRVGDARERL